MDTGTIIISVHYYYYYYYYYQSQNITWVACFDFQAYSACTWSAFPLCPLCTKCWYSWSIAFSCRARGASADTPCSLHMAAHSSALELSLACMLKDSASMPAWNVGNERNHMVVVVVVQVPESSYRTAVHCGIGISIPQCTAVPYNNSGACGCSRPTVYYTIKNYQGTDNALAYTYTKLTSVHLPLLSSAQEYPGHSISPLAPVPAAGAGWHPCFCIWLQCCSSAVHVPNDQEGIPLLHNSLPDWALLAGNCNIPEGWPQPSLAALSGLFHQIFAAAASPSSESSNKIINFNTEYMCRVHAEHDSFSQQKSLPTTDGMIIITLGKL